VTKPAIERKKQEDLARLEAEKAAAEKLRKEQELKKARDNAGLELYNQINGTRHMTWSQTAVYSQSVREQWADKAEELRKLKRQSNPFIVDGGITAAQINAATITSDQLRSNFRRSSIFGF
jgi:hypothetical protein